MKSKLIGAGAIATLALGIAACGTSGTTPSSSATGSQTAGSHSSGNRSHRRHHSGLHGHIYLVALSGKQASPPGAPRGAGLAVVALHARGGVRACWRFAHLHGFTSALGASVNRGSRGTSGPVVIAMGGGSRLHHRGCVPITAAVIKEIEKRPSDYYVNVRSARYPSGAVRAQL